MWLLLNLTNIFLYHVFQVISRGNRNVFLHVSPFCSLYCITYHTQYYCFHSVLEMENESSKNITRIKWKASPEGCSQSSLPILGYISAIPGNIPGQVQAYTGSKKIRSLLCLSYTLTQTHTYMYLIHMQILKFNLTSLFYFN